MKPASRFRHWWFKIGLIVIVPLLAASLIAACVPRNWARGKPVERPGVTLYGPNDHEIKDATGFQLALPADFSIQSQAFPLPIDDERVIAKCKREVDGKLPAWLSISVKKEAADKPLAELVKKKKPDNGNPKQVGGVEDLQVDNNPAARVVFEMRYHEHDFLREVVAIRKGEQVYYVKCQYVKEDKGNVRDLMRDAVAGAHWMK